MSQYANWRCALALGVLLAASGATSGELIAQQRGVEVVGALQGLEISEYHALIISVQDYEEDLLDLDHPRQDADALQTLLETQYTFERSRITRLIDPSRVELYGALEVLRETLDPTDNLLVFYAGHGQWDAELEQGYWLPADARRTSRSEWIDNGTVRDFLRGIRAHHILLIADACFSGGVLRTRNALEVTPADATVTYRSKSRKALTSGALETVPDRSEFMNQLLRVLGDSETPYLFAQELYSSLVRPVINNSPTQQRPLYGTIQRAGDEDGDFVFFRRGEGTPVRPQLEDRRTSPSVEVTDQGSRDRTRPATPTTTSATGTIVGVVTDSRSGRPVEGVEVEVYSTMIGALTNANGRYLILNVPIGSYEVRVRFAGYRESVASVEVMAGGTAVLDVELDRLNER